MFKKILIADAETRWSKGPCDWAPDGYTLTSMTTEEYLRSPLFKAFGFGFKWYGDTHGFWVGHADLPRFFASVDWSTTAVACHNAQFDAGILSWHYGVIPCLILDTLSMARGVRGPDAGNSAAVLAQALGLPPKGTATQDTNGLFDLTPEAEAALIPYCLYDVDLCEAFLKEFSHRFNRQEILLIDATVRMFTQPQLTLNKEKLQNAIAEEQCDRTALLARLKIEEANLASNDKFALALQDLGIEPPKKISKTTGKETFAFAKNDALFQAILNGDNADAVLLCEARMKVKSTQMRTRAQRFLDIANRGMMPVPVTIYGTRTLRWAAAKNSAQNMQNLKRGGVLREAIEAPDGYVVVAGDLSQIEPRVLAYLSDHAALLESFKTKDPYALFGADMFGVPGMTKESHPALRQSAKSAMLGAGYRLGWASFATQLLTGFLGADPVRYDEAFAKQLGVTAHHVYEFIQGRNAEERLERMAQIPRSCTDEELLIHCVCAKFIIDKYRAASKPIVEFWGKLGQLLDAIIAAPEAASAWHGCLKFSKGAIYLPNGLAILYEGIERTWDDKFRSWSYTYMNGKTRKPLHSGILAENVTSALARCVIADGMARIQKRYRVAMPVHDEAVYVVPEHEKDEAVAFVRQCMTQEPAYLPGLLLAADVGSHKSYGLAKK